MSFNFDISINRNETSSIKWDKYKNRDVIPLWISDMDFLSPPCVINALKERVEHGIFGYTHIPAELVEIIIKRVKHNYNWEVLPEWFIWLPGIVPGINIACHSIGEEYDKIMTSIPIYPPFLAAQLNSKKIATRVPLAKENRRWTFDFDNINNLINKKTKLFLLCNPHNPAGTVFRKDELIELAKICEENNTIICSDEIHCDFILDLEKKHIPIASIDPDIAKRVITLMSPTKTFNMCGLGFAYAIIPDTNIRNKFKNFMQGMMSINLFSYIATLNGYKYGHEWHVSLLKYLRGNRDSVENSIQSIKGLQIEHSEATYLAWIDIRELGLNDPIGFFEKNGVGLTDGKDFGGDGFVRLNFGCPQIVLKEALSRIHSAINSI